MVSLLGTLGCYQAFELDRAAERDASMPRDAGLDARDADRPDTGRDAGRDTAGIVPPVDDSDDLPPLPPPEPTPSPDDRPSDDDDAWVDEAPTNEPCCADEPTHTLNDGTDVDGPPVVAWDGDGERWLVAWPEGAHPDWRIAMRFLDADARPLGPVRYLPGYSGQPRSLAYGNGRFALFCDGYAGDAQLKVLTILDSELRVRANYLVDEPGFALAVVRYPAVGGWAIVHNFAAEKTYVDAVGDDMVRRARHELPYADFASLVAFKARLVAVHAYVDRGVNLDRFVGVLEHEPTWTLPRVPGEGGFASTSFTATRLRDRVVVSVNADVPGGEVKTFVYDPFTTERLELDAWSLAPRTTEDTPGAYSSVGDDVLGVAAHCVSSRLPTGGPALDVVLTDPSRVVATAEAFAIPGMAVRSNPVGCAIAPSRTAGTYTVVWWDTVFAEGTNFIRGKRMPLVRE